MMEQKRMNYKGYEVSYDELFEKYFIYDEDMIPLSCAFATMEEAQAYIDRF